MMFISGPAVLLMWTDKQGPPFYLAVLFSGLMLHPLETLRGLLRLIMMDPGSLGQPPVEDD